MTFLAWMFSHLWSSSLNSGQSRKAPFVVETNLNVLPVVVDSFPAGGSSSRGSRDGALWWTVAPGQQRRAGRKPLETLKRRLGKTSKTSPLSSTCSTWLCLSRPWDIGKCILKVNPKVDPNGVVTLGGGNSMQMEGSGTPLVWMENMILKKLCWKTLVYVYIGYISLFCCIHFLHYINMWT